jgi:hypothetical protein
MKQLLFSQILLILCLLVNIGLAQERSGKTKVGPENGTLLIVGGGAGKEMYERFIELAGGNDAPLVYISTASPSMTAEQREERGDRLRALGATNVTVMHTLDRSVANSEAFVAPLKEAKGVWFGGGGNGIWSMPMRARKWKRFCGKYWNERVSLQVALQERRSKVRTWRAVILATIRLWSVTTRWVLAT